MLAAVCAIAAAALSGCGTLAPFSPYEIGARMNGEYLEADGAWRDRFNSASTAQDRANLARELAFMLLGRSDRKCENYLVGISSGRNAFGGSLDLLSMGLGVAATGASSLGSATELAGGSSFIQSLRQTSDSRLFANHDTGTIYRVVHQGRAVERQALMTAIAGGRFDTWGPEAIAAVVNAYDVKCGVNYANSLIREAVENNAGNLQPAILLPGDEAGGAVPETETEVNDDA
ncbi:MAG: hypothetical protein ACK4FB_02235 [Brevundimonas sp.]|uniref:hypothetical protein n=1 Tax=Brevundimonas sp. TaxID=1871086 RepID=UPI00391D6818